MDKKEKIDFDKGLKLIAKSSVIVFIGVFLSKVFAYLYRIIIARHYGPEIYGLFALSMMVAGWFAGFAGLGLNQGLLRYISVYRGTKKPSKASYLFSRSIKTLITTGILSGILVFIFAEFIAMEIE